MLITQRKIDTGKPVLTVDKKQVEARIMPPGTLEKIRSKNRQTGSNSDI